MPGLPVGFVNSQTPYFACSGGSNGCDWIMEGVLPVIPHFVTGTGDTGYFGDPDEQTALADGCTQYRSIFFEQIAALVARGGCTFTNKMLIADHALFSSVLVEDTSGASALTIPGLLPGTPAGMPLFFLITPDVATELRIPLIKEGNYRVASPCPSAGRRRRYPRPPRCRFWASGWQRSVLPGAGIVRVSSRGDPHLHSVRKKATNARRYVGRKKLI